MSETILRAEGLVKSYRTGSFDLQVLKGVSFELAAGEFVSIQGESGCGKTTFLNLLAGLESPDTGRVIWAAEDISRASRNRLARERARFLGIVFQSYYLVPELNALDNVLLNLRIAQGVPGKEEREKARSMLERVGLADRFAQMPATLSGGERQRVAIARAMVTDPRVILADEPTGNLDERTGNAVMDLLQELCSACGAALTLVTHNPAHAARAERQLVIGAGRFIDQPDSADGGSL